MKLTTDFIVKATRGELVSDPVSVFTTYTADNRDPQIKGKIFIPLVGDNHDAHDFVTKALEAGAAGALVHQWHSEWDAFKNKVSFIKVDDTLKALQNLAREWRQHLPAKILALTGSNGKTTTKDFLNQILSQFDKTLASHGSFNNHWGVPFTLLNTTDEYKFCVVEMGMNHAGEITTLNGIAQPDVVAVTNVGRAHMGHFTNGIQGVAAAKEEIYVSAPEHALFIFNLDNDYTRSMKEKYKDRKHLTFSSLDSTADVFLKIKGIRSTGYRIEGQIGGIKGETDVAIWGEQNVQNLAAATALAFSCGLDARKIWQAFEPCHTGWGRNHWVKLKSGGTALFDGYNANPDSFAQLLSNVQKTWDPSHPYIAIFGEMLELGANTSDEHCKLGELAAQLPWENCIFIGPSAAEFRKGWLSGKSKITPVIFDTYKESLDLDLQSMLNEKTQVIVKGSRGGALERIIERMDPINFVAK